MDVKVVDQIDAIAPAQWNALAGADNPFLRHELIGAFERSGCAVPRTGWRPQHLAVYEDGRLIGAAPVYCKDHSYGEFVFDFAWAEAYRRSGLQYYPKLISAIPFSPVTGRRLLIADHPRREEIARLLIDAALGLAHRTGASSMHWLFPDAHDMGLLETHGMLRRNGVQYHWLNPGYRDFEDFLSTFQAQKRKKVKRERRHVAETGVTIELLEGRAIQPWHCDLMHDFHQATIQRYAAPPFLTRAFFHALAQSMPQSVVMVLARHGREYVGAALHLVGSDTLYGRYWGGRPGYNSLHFEVCYYSAIDYCIAKGLKRFEGGAGGEHKLARGFVPVATRSAHWLRHAQFARAVAEFLARERNGIELYLDELNEHTPFKKAAG